MIFQGYVLMICTWQCNTSGVQKVCPKVYPKKQKTEIHKIAQPCSNWGTGVSSIKLIKEVILKSLKMSFGVGSFA